MHRSDKGVDAMKRLLSAALSLTLLGASVSAASADPYDHYRYHRDHDGNGAAIFAGFGLLTLAAVLASQHRHDHDGWYRDCGYVRDDDGYYHRVCERPYYDGYDRGYGRGYRDGYYNGY
jgi:hypothetical protein